MPDPIVPQSDLEQMAGVRFDPLSVAEIKLLRAAPKGETAHCGTSVRDDDPDNDPAGGDKWSPERSIRAELIRWLCVDSQAKNLIDPRGIRAHAARITEKLDLSFVVVPSFLGLRLCSFSDSPNLRFIEIPAIDLTRACLPSLNAEHGIVKGNVSLNGLRSKGIVRLFRMRIGGSLECDGAKLQNPAVANIANSGTALRAEGVKVTGSVLLRNGFAAEGQVDLYGAEIVGNLNCAGGMFKNPPAANVANSGIALTAEGAKVSGNILLREGFLAEGQVSLHAAEVGGSLDCEGGKFENPALANVADSGMALNAEAARVTIAIFLRHGFAAQGQVRLYGAEIGGSVVCDGGKFQNMAVANVANSGLALMADRAKVGRDVLLRNGFVAKGQVGLSSTEIGSTLDCGGGMFRNPAAPDVANSGTALTANGAKVGGPVYLRNGFTATGLVRLYGIRIGGNLECDGGTFQNPVVANIADTGTALDAEGAKIAGAVLLRNGFTAEGQVSLFAAEIGSNLECDAGTFQNPAVANVTNSGTALNAEGAKVARAVLLRNGFAAEGQVRLFGVEVGGNFACDGAKFRNPAVANIANSGTALIADGAKVGRHLHLRKGFVAQGKVLLYSVKIGGDLDCQQGTFESLDLRNTSAGAILDNEKSWPESGKLFLDGFTYGRISRGPAAAKERLAWLAKQVEFTRQPYRQLAKALKEAGDDRGWRRVCAEMERKTWEGKSWIYRPASWLLRGTIGYGYFSMRALWWLLALVIVGSFAYWQGYEAGNMLPTNKEAYERFIAQEGLPEYYEAFHSFPYSLENSFPLIKLGVQDKWAPAAEEQVPARKVVGWGSHVLWRATSSSFLRAFRWFQICAGWILATLFVAGVTGVIRKE